MTRIFACLVFIVAASACTDVVKGAFGSRTANAAAASGWEQVPCDVSTSDQNGDFSADLPASNPPPAVVVWIGNGTSYHSADDLAFQGGTLSVWGDGSECVVWAAR